MATRTGSARKLIADGRSEGRGGPGVAAVRPPELCKVLGKPCEVDPCPRRSKPWLSSTFTGWASGMDPRRSQGIADVLHGRL